MPSSLTRLRPVRLGALTVAAAAALAVALAAPAGSALAHEVPNAFQQTNLISDRTDQGAQVVDPDLRNAWGLAMTATSPLWVANNNSGTSTIYTIPAGGTTAKKAGLTVTVPGGRVSTGDSSSPTGQVANSTAGFVVTSNAGSGPALFIFSSESGQITAWNPTADPISAGMSTASLVFSSPTAVYKGLAMGSTSDGSTFLYASNFHDGTVDVFNSQFQHVFLAGHFRDPFLPRGYAPFGIQELNGQLYVTYALQDAARHDDVAGLGHGFVDVFTNDGFLVRRLVSGGVLDSPWGLAIAPAGFGPFGGQLLVGNFRNGLIHVYSLTGRPEGRLRNAQHKPIQIDHLWALTFGTASTGGTGTLLFSAGINDEQDGLVGSINPAP
ncbi:MAG TPA: TIGR03118 family protein [Streptosporangiaceae bacterium]|nr:TIGR03118 family protein [Streptosporangiaceae bacterium]